MYIPFYIQKFVFSSVTSQTYTCFSLFNCHDIVLFGVLLKNCGLYPMLLKVFFLYRKIKAGSVCRFIVRTYVNVGSKPFSKSGFHRAGN